MRKNRVQNTVVGKSVWKLLNSVANRFIHMTMHFTMASSKLYLKEISALNCLSKILR